MARANGPFGAKKWRNSALLRMRVRKRESGGDRPRAHPFAFLDQDLGRLVQALHKLKVGETVEEILKADLALEMEAIPLLKDAIQHCEGVRDYTSREIFERILESEEEHVDFLETQFEMIQRMGLQNYVQLQSEPAGNGDS